MNAREASARHSFVGSRIGKFDVIAEIGTGGMASVYLARATSTAGFNRLVAIKVMHPHLSQEDSFVEMFLDEARVAATIQHPNVVSIIDVGIEDGLIFLIMEYVEGDSFSNIQKMAVNLKRRIPLGIVLRIVLDAAAGLQHAHELTDHQGNPLRIVHRDVSPQNIMVGVDGTARIVDFGIAKAESRITTTQVGLIKGKLNFMAPEQIRGGALDRRVDVFGLGVTLWEAVTLRRLFAGDNEFETARRILTGEYPSMCEYDPKIPAELDEICRRALYPDPEYRFHTCAELADAIEGSLPHLVAAPREVSAFISGVASQKIERERIAIRETLATPTAMEVDDDLDDEPGFMSTTVVEIPGGTDSAPSAVHPIRAVMPSSSAPRDRSHEESSTTRRAPIRAPTMTMPSHAPQASGHVATVSSGVHNDPTATTRALRAPPAAGAHDVYDDDGATSPFNAVAAAAQAKAFRDRIVPVAPASSGSSKAGPSRVQAVYDDEPDDDSTSEARTVFQPSYAPPPQRTSSPSRSDASMSGPVPSYLSPVETSQVAPAARTMAIDLVQRRLSPDDLVEASSEVPTASAQAPFAPPPPAHAQSTGGNDLFALPSAVPPAQPYSLGPSADTSSQPPSAPQFPMIPPDAARVSHVTQTQNAGLPAVVYVLLSLVLVGGAATALWFVLRGS